jgi:hypothetical protein
MDWDKISNLYRVPSICFLQSFGSFRKVVSEEKIFRNRPIRNKMLPNKFRFIWPNGFRQESLKSANQKQESPVAAMFVIGSGRNE